jgi:hypothetical protein
MLGHLLRKYGFNINDGLNVLIEKMPGDGLFFFRS